MLKYFMLIIISIVFTSFGEDFNIFENNRAEKMKLYYTLKHHKLRVKAGATFQGSKADVTNSLAYNYFFNKKIASLVEIGNIYNGGDFDDMVEVNAGITYRITKRTQDLVFLGDLGISLNRYLETKNTFSVNHIFAGLNCEYTWNNGFGFDISLQGYMPFIFSVDENIIIKSSIAFIYQFN
ncbi:MAG: hypothetical protein CR982_10000 [Candidatus Cloacimonadota bacterium]|nr:MAG: hypothetical protein CR982_10000 [Candidatus Cloacimonadota bacterium]PIE81632.1 MAG: hypothetical protein CSA15_00480 [Candidatus Delongbacteria bacterium]